MAFDSLSEKLQNVFKNLRSKGRLTEDDVKTALKEVKMALLEADVNFRVVKKFVKDVQERAIGQDVMSGLNPGQMVIKIVNEEMVKLMGSETTEIAFRPGKELTVIMMVGLQGAGKTTTTAKIAGKLKTKGKKTLLAACDVYRPAAIEQLQINGEKQGVEVFSMGNKNKPADIAKAAVEHAKKEDCNVLIIDTAGRLHVDEEMMDELVEIKEAVDVFQTILVVDAMTGQDAVNVASTFNDKIGIDGVVLTKLDGDTRGGAALSIRAVTGKPILFYVPDAENFEDYRGLYFGFDKLPGPAVSTPEKLGELLKDLPGVAVSCKGKYEKAREQICPRDDGKACKRIAEVLLDGKEPVNPVYLNQTDKVKLLVYAGDFSDTQETEAFYEFLNKVDYEHFDVTLIGNGAKEEESSEKLNSLPKEIRVLYWKRSYPATDEEYVCHKKFMKSKKTEVPEMLLDFYRRELRRMIGMSKFDYALVFTDMKKFFPAMSGALDVKQIFNIENWQNLLKC